MKEKKIARDTRNREKLAGDDWVMAEFYATWCPHCQRMQPLIKEFKKEMERDSRGSTGRRRRGK